MDRRSFFDVFHKHLQMRDSLTAYLVLPPLTHFPSARTPFTSIYQRMKGKKRVTRKVKNTFGLIKLYLLDLPLVIAIFTQISFTYVIRSGSYLHFSSFMGYWLISSNKDPLDFKTDEVYHESERPVTKFRINLIWVFTPYYSLYQTPPDR